MTEHLTIYTYRYLLMSAQRAYLRAHEDKDSVLTESMSVILFSALALEAFLNHLGAQLIQHWAPLKRKLSPPEKLDVILAQAHLSIDWSSRPYQSFRMAFQFRNLIAHAETERIAIEMASSDQTLPEAKWQTYCTLPTAKRILEDTVVIFQTLPAQLGLHTESPGFLLAETI